MLENYCMHEIFTEPIQFQHQGFNSPNWVLLRIRIWCFIVHVCTLYMKTILTISLRLLWFIILLTKTSHVMKVFLSTTKWQLTNSAIFYLSFILVDAVYRHTAQLEIKPRIKQEQKHSFSFLVSFWFSELFFLAYMYSVDDGLLSIYHLSENLTIYC